MRTTPDETERHKKAVDLSATTPDRMNSLVLEHTSVDSFLRQRVLSRWCVELLEPLERELDHTLPAPGHYVLGVNPAESKGLRRAGSRIRSSLANWIRERAPALEIGLPLGAGRHCDKLDVLGLGLVVTLYRWGHLDGRFFVHFNVPEDFERQRRAQLVIALDQKCPKLWSAKVAAGNAVSVLVLETSDLALGNEIEIAQIVNDELRARRDAPDQVYVVETAIQPWSWLVARDGLAEYPNIPGEGPSPL
ncbi:MAG: hypothetical protein ACRENS_01180 [Candidatus Eiseniibacteriota bacterium]